MTRKEFVEAVEWLVSISDPYYHRSAVETGGEIIEHYDSVAKEQNGGNDE